MCINEDELSMHIIIMIIHILFLSIGFRYFCMFSKRCSLVKRKGEKKEDILININGKSWLSITVCDKIHGSTYICQNCPIFVFQVTLTLWSVGFLGGGGANKLSCLWITCWGWSHKKNFLHTNLGENMTARLRRYHFLFCMNLFFFIFPKKNHSMYDLLIVRKVEVTCIHFRFAPSLMAK